MKMRVSHPGQLEMSYLAKLLNLNVYYGSTAFSINNNIVIMKSNEQKEWQLFGHEVGHYLRHTGNHLVMHPLFMDFQEYQATNFAYHFCVPTFMLEKMQPLSVYDVINLFNVEYDFAYRRLEMYERKIINERTHYQKRESILYSS